MKSSISLRRGTRGRAIGLCLALLALLALVLLGPVVHAAMMRAGMMDMSSMDMPMSGEMPMCHAAMADAGTDKPGPPAQHRHEPDCAMCPLCAALAHPAMAAHPAPYVPSPGVVLVVRPELPPGARAPPTLHASAAQPRGPPAQV